MVLVSSFLPIFCETTPVCIYLNKKDKCVPRLCESKFHVETFVETVVYTVYGVENEKNGLFHYLS